jgi:uncharacterized repeat protein (TIGR03803 family)
MKLNVFLSSVFLLLLQPPLARSQTLEVLHYFQGADGSSPSAGLTLGRDGNFYGAAASGGANNHGTLFQMAPGGVLTVLHSFALDSSDGDSPATPPVEGTNGVFYGTANFYFYCVSSGGAFTNLGNGAGGWSGSGLIPGSAGNFFGVNNSQVYQLAPDGNLTPLFTFPFHGALQLYPNLVEASDGSLYGVDENGGTNSEGMVFKITRTAGDVTDTFAELTEFNYSNGSSPTAGLIHGSDGNFYGTTRGGAPNGYGTVFRMTPDGDLTTIFAFHGTDGSGPQALIQASDGNFYGTTSVGGAQNAGTVFRLTTDGVLTSLCSFMGTNGSNPQAGLVQGPDGHLYGTTSKGGIVDSGNSSGYGTVFRVVLPPVLEAPAVTNGLITLAWRLMPGQTYQLQFSTDLANWFNQGAPETATASRVSFSEAVESNAQRFYRVMLTQ